MLVGFKININIFNIFKAILWVVSFGVFAKINLVFIIFRKLFNFFITLK